MPGLPQPLYRQIRQALLACDEINDPAQLRSILRTSVLSPFANSFRAANNPNTQVDYLIGDLAERRLTSGENALVLLLELLANHYDRADARHDELVSLAAALQNIRTDVVPPSSASTSEHKSNVAIDGDVYARAIGGADASSQDKTPDRHTTLRKLRTVLAHLYPDLESTRRLATDVGLPVAMIGFNTRAIDNWFNILGEAEKQNKLEALIELVLSEYPVDPLLNEVREALFGVQSDSDEPRTRGRHLRPVPAVQSTTPAEIQRRYALLVGVRDYVDPNFRPLPHTVYDVIELEKVLSSAGYTVRCLHSAQTEEHLKPTRDNIWGELENLASQTGPGDLLLVHFCGHGQLYGDKAYLITSQTRAASLPRTAIDLDELTKTLANTPAQARILILDACHAGMGRSATGMDPDFERHIYLQAEGMATLAACRQQQVAYEHDQSSHGAFTYFLLEGLRGTAHHSQRFITFTNLNHYVTDQVKRWAIGRSLQQTPNASTHLVGDPALIELRQM